MKPYYQKLINDDFEFCKRLSHFLREHEAEFIEGLKAGKYRLYVPETRARLRAIVLRLCEVVA